MQNSYNKKLPMQSQCIKTTQCFQIFGIADHILIHVVHVMSVAAYCWPNPKALDQ